MMQAPVFLLGQRVATISDDGRTSPMVEEIHRAVEAAEGRLGPEGEIPAEEDRADALADFIERSSGWRYTIGDWEAGVAKDIMPAPGGPQQRPGQTAPPEKDNNMDDVEKVWSDEAREAALEARRRNAEGVRDPEGESLAQRRAHAALREHGWVVAPRRHPDAPSQWTHPSRPKEVLHVDAGGSWMHTGGEGGFAGEGQTAGALERHLAGEPVRKSGTIEHMPAEWTAKRIAALPDSAFGYVEPGGARATDGRTIPLALRHLPFKDEDGNVDPAMLREALAGAEATNLPRATLARVKARLEKYITHDGGGWQARAESGRVLGEHDSKADAVRQLAAVEAGKARAEEFEGEGVEKAWSDEARAAALEARRAHAAPKPGSDVPSPSAHQEFAAYGWDHAGGGRYMPRSGELAGHSIQVSSAVPPSGRTVVSWTHTGPDGAVGASTGVASLQYHLMRANQRAGVGTLDNGFTNRPDPGEGRAARAEGGRRKSEGEGVDRHLAALDKSKEKSEEIQKTAPGMRVQSLVFDKEFYPGAKDAKGWANDHGFSDAGLREGDKAFTLRQQPPAVFGRTQEIALATGVRAVVGTPRQAVAALQAAVTKIMEIKKIVLKSLDGIEAEPVAELEYGTLYKVQAGGQRLWFAEAGGVAAWLPMYFRLDSPGFTPIAKSEEQRYTLSVVYPCSKSGAPEPDFHGDIMTEAELEKAAWGFMSKDDTGNRIGIMHRPGTGGAGRCVESYIWRGGEMTMKDVGGADQVVTPGSWVMGIVWTPESWGVIKSGGIMGLSLQGVAHKASFDGGPQ